MAPKKPIPPTPGDEPTDETTATPDVADALAGRGLDRPPAPFEVDASRLTPRPLGPFKGGIILNDRGRCAICNGVGDHVHTRPGLPEHVHTDAPAEKG